MTLAEKYEVIIAELAEVIQSKNDLIAWKNNYIHDLEKRLEEAEREAKK